MKNLASALTSCVLLTLFLGAIDPSAAVTEQLAREINERGLAHADLTELAQGGPRLSGSSGAARAVDWGVAKMNAYGFERVWKQPVRAPSWTRGKIARATLDNGMALNVAALGRSPGTPAGGVEAEVVEVQSLDEVARLGSKVRGKIVFYNRAMDASLADTFEAYGRAADQRMSGPAQAEKFGAVAVLVRSLTTLADDDHPHTGATRAAGIASAAVSTHGAGLLSRELRARPGLKLRLELDCANGPAVPSYNVIGEITGSELPGEVVVVGGHLDSWDLGQGAHDDGAGVVQSLEALRAMKALGLRPRRTIRAVLFMSEELGGIGGREYAAWVKAHGEKHVLAIESDRGGFAPLGFEGSPGSLEFIERWRPNLAPLHADRLQEGGGGTDIDFLAELGVPTVGFVPVSTHYFDLHHSALDRIEAVSREELHGGAAAIAALAWLAAN